MSPFDAILANDLDFMNQDVFADPEPVVLTRADGSQRRFYAVIERNPPTFVAGMKDDPRATRWPTFRMTISRNVLGCAPDKNGDKLTFPSHLGDMPTDHVITNIPAEDGGGWYVECR